MGEGKIEGQNQKGGVRRGKKVSYCKEQRAVLK